MTKKKIEPVKRKIAILGNSQLSLVNAPYDDLSWKIWDMSANFQYGKRFDLFFEVHTLEVLKAYTHLSPSYTDKYTTFLKSAGKALIAGHPSEAWPDAQIYPISEILHHFDDDYFTCTFAYMMAFAIYQHDKSISDGGVGISEIGIWGVDMAVDEEYNHQKPCAEHWIGVAKGRGIKVTIAQESPICRTNAPYGFANPKLSREFTDRIVELKSTIAQEENKLKDAELVVQQHRVNLLELKACQRLLGQLCHRWAL